MNPETLKNLFAWKKWEFVWEYLFNLFNCVIIINNKDSPVFCKVPGSVVGKIEATTVVGLCEDERDDLKKTLIEKWEKEFQKNKNFL